MAVGILKEIKDEIARRRKKQLAIGKLPRLARHIETMNTELVNYKRLVKILIECCDDCQPRYLLEATRVLKGQRKTKIKVDNTCECKLHTFVD